MCLPQVPKHASDFLASPTEGRRQASMRLLEVHLELTYLETLFLPSSSDRTTFRAEAHRQPQCRPP